MSVSSQLNWACNFIVGLVFPYMNVYLGAYSFVPFAIVLLAAYILPETQGSTPEQLTAEMTRTLSSAVVYQSNTESVQSHGSVATGRGNGEKERKVRLWLSSYRNR
jgi:SP family facilitated glucose transporter-like MFS transporter 3